jgi:hypothetical protein
MKLEYGGTGNKNEIVRIFEPGQIPSSVLSNVEEFRFPREDFLSINERKKEIDLDSQ